MPKLRATKIKGSTVAALAEVYECHSSLNLLFKCTNPAVIITCKKIIFMLPENAIASEYAVFMHSCTCVPVWKPINYTAF